jgi:hypothetical protein
MAGLSEQTIRAPQMETESKGGERIPLLGVPLLVVE